MELLLTQVINTVSGVLDPYLKYTLLPCLRGVEPEREECTDETQGSSTGNTGKTSELP